jgi:hypothetical protein
MIYLNDILKFTNLKKVKLRFNLKFGTNIPPIHYFISSLPADKQKMLEGQYWNSTKKVFRKNDITLGFIPIPNKPDCWLLFHIGKVKKDLDIYNGIGYEYDILSNYNKFIGRVIIRFKNTARNLVRLGDTILSKCIVEEILPQVYNNNIFPGYNNVYVSWHELNQLIHTTSWKTALQNQKGIYLLVDTKTGKMYIGSAYGNDMLHARWMNYINTCHGGNKELKKLKQDYIKDYFYFSILETFNQNVSDQTIIERESYWKQVLGTRQFGYNRN